MIRFFALAVLATVVGCGGINVEAPKAQNPQGDQNGNEQGSDQGSASTDAGKPSETDVPPTATAEPARHDSQNNHTANVPAWRLDQVARNWEDARDAAPVGMRLATRGEVVTLLDAGELDPLRSSDQADLGDVWSITTDRDLAVFVDLDNGISASQDRALRLKAVYVRGD